MTSNCEQTLGLFLREGAGVLQYGLIAAAWSALMLGASAWRLRELSGGGEVVAEALEGARLYAPASAAERRLVNSSSDSSPRKKRANSLSAP